ncbi:MAG: acyltransferase [Ilumatobacteraceae bacterium]
MPDSADETSPPTRASWRLGQRPALDGVRGLAIVMVLLGHAGWPSLHRAEEFGVELFFVLSGLLITGVLLGERLHSGRIGFGQFYIRRARRLLPALLTMLAVLAVVRWLGFTRWGITGYGLLGGLTYTSNFLFIAGNDMGSLVHLWSLAVEEHFYFVWPLILMLAAGRKAARVRTAAVLTTIGVLVAASFAFRAYLVYRDGGSTSDRMFPATELRASSPLIGAALAVVLARWQPRFAHRAWQVGGVLAVVAFGYISITVKDAPPSYWFIALPASTLASVLLLIATLAPSGIVVDTFSMGWLQWLGRHSYSAYLWHYPIFFGLGTLKYLSTAKTAIGIAATLIIAALSTKFIEEPFRRRRAATN